MGLRELVRGGIKTAKTAVGNLPVQITHRPYKSTSGGDILYGSKKKYAVVMEVRTRVFRMGDGQERTSQHYLLFLEEITIDLMDEITLPNGTKPPILSVGGVLDSGTNVPFYAEVYLG